jgi:hypothetical protein
MASGGGEEIVLPFPVPGSSREDVPMATEFRSTWLTSSIRSLSPVSFRNWSTTDADADLSVQAILRCAKTVAAETGSPVGA